MMTEEQKLIRDLLYVLKSGITNYQTITELAERAKQLGVT